MELVGEVHGAEELEAEGVEAEDLMDLRSVEVQESQEPRADDGPEAAKACVQHLMDPEPEACRRPP